MRAGISDFLKRMSTYFPFPSSSVSYSSGLDAGLELNLAYARMASLLAPQPVQLQFPADTPSSRQGRDPARTSRLAAVEQAWQVMRETADRKREKGKGKAEVWAMDEVSAWVAGLLVGCLTDEADSPRVPLVTYLSSR